MLAMMGFVAMAIAGFTFVPGLGPFAEDEEDDKDGLRGTREDDQASLGPGNDLVAGLGGDDYLDGGEGDDTVAGGTGADDLHGGAGQDIVSGGPGDDVIAGHIGDDRIFGMGGDDELNRRRRQRCPDRRGGR